MNDDNKQKETDGVMSAYQLNDINKLICESFDFEKIRLDLRQKTKPDNKEITLVVAWIYQKYIEVDYAMFFTARQLQELTQEVFSTIELRSFVLNLTERVSNGLAVFPEGTVEKFKSKIKESIDRTRTKAVDEEGVPLNNTSLISADILTSYYIGTEVVESILKDNFWLLVIYQLLQNLHHTVAFEHLLRMRVVAEEEQKS